jgi:uncharacterized protein (DUF3084 family)
MADDAVAQLEQLRDQVEVLIHEARGTVKDLRQATREAREAFKELVEDRIEREVSEQLSEFAEVNSKQMRLSVAKITAEFDKLSDSLLGPVKGPGLRQLVDQAHAENELARIGLLAKSPRKKKR